MVILWLCAGIGVRYVQMKDITKINHMILLLYPIIGIDLFISVRDLIKNDQELKINDLFDIVFDTRHANDCQWMEL